jgi:hypothetical protein
MKPHKNYALCIFLLYTLGFAPDRPGILHCAYQNNHENKNIHLRFSSLVFECKEDRIQETGVRMDIGCGICYLG